MKEWTPYILLGLLIAVLGIFSPSSLHVSHLLTVLAQAAPLIIVAIGQSFVIFVGGIDLSVGSVISLANVLACSLISGDASRTGTTILICLAVGLAIGTINGFAISYGFIPDFVMTLGMGAVIQGVTYIFTKGSPVGNVEGFLLTLANDRFLGIIPWSVIFVALVFALTFFMLNGTRYGRKLYATGGNATAAVLSGINVRLVKTIAYAISGVMSVTGGLLLSGFVRVASVGIGADYVLYSIAAVILGGASFAGGIGKLQNSIIGALTLVFLTNLLTILRVGQPGKFIVQGSVIIAIAYLYVTMKGENQ